MAGRRNVRRMVKTQIIPSVAEARHKLPGCVINGRLEKYSQGKVPLRSTCPISSLALLKQREEFSFSTTTDYSTSSQIKTPRAVLC